MNSHSIWVYVHILLFVFWLGADMGVFFPTLMARNHRLSFEARSTLIRVAVSIDLFPRVCFALLIPVGLHLARGLGLYPLSDGMLALGWVIGIGWIGLIFAIIANEDRPVAHALGTAQMFLQIILGLIFSSLGVWSLLTGGPFSETWFALKILMFGLVFWAAMAIDFCFRPFAEPFAQIGASGSTPELEAVVTRTINRTLSWALVLYLLIAAIAFMGVVKPL
jgi:hypothetical protein